MENKIIKSTEIHAPIEKVWSAITDSKKFGEWFGARIDQNFKAGELSSWQMITPGHEHFKWETRIKKIKPMTYFSMTWPCGAEQGQDETEKNWTLVEFQLEETITGTKVTITESNFENVPENRRSQAFRDNTGGWEHQIKNLLQYF